MNYLVVLFLLIGNLSFGSMSVLATDAKKDQPLITDLKYDEEKRIISGKTAPNSNVFLKNVAGSVIASENGEFEFPVPENTKVSVITILDAERDQSTDVRYNFEKKTIESETSKKTDTAGTTTNSAATEKTDSEKKTDTSETKTKKTNNQVASSTSSTKKATGEKPTEISEEVYQPKKEEPKRSLIWLWTLLGIVIVIGGAVGGYVWYKKKIEKEEREKSRKKGKRPNRNREKERPSKDKGKKGSARRQETRRPPYKEDPTEKAKRAIDQLEESKYLDYLIDTELSNLQEEKRSRSSRSKVKEGKEKTPSADAKKKETQKPLVTPTSAKKINSSTSHQVPKDEKVSKVSEAITPTKQTPSSKKQEEPKGSPSDKNKAKIASKDSKEVKEIRRDDRQYREEKSKGSSRKARPKRNSRDRNKKRKK